MKLNLIIYLICFFAIISCSSIKTVKVDTLKNVSAKGVYYALPRNAVVVDVFIKKNLRIPGPYSKFASQFLDINDAIKQRSLQFEIVDVQLNSYSEPDPDQYYLLNIKNGLFCKNKAVLNLSESGLILGINSVKKSDSSFAIDNAVKNISTAQNFKYLAFSDILKEKIDTSYQFAQLDSFSFKRTIIETSFVRKSIEDQAGEAANQIITLNRKKLDILTSVSENNLSAPTVKYMVDQLSTLEQNYLNLFTGVSNTEIVKYRFVLVPTWDNLEIPLFNFSSKIGVLPIGNAAGDLITLIVKSTDNTKSIKNNQLKQDSLGYKSKAGFVYRIPAIANISLKSKEKEYASQRINISQLGQIVKLPKKIFSTQSSVDFYKNSGNIQQIILK